MDRAEEIFTMQLARAAGKTANRFLQMRGLQTADRDDIVSAALLWCWEHRDNYSLTTTLETWFMYSVRHAWEAWRRKEIPVSNVSLDRVGGADEAYNIAEAESAATALLSALTPVDREIALLTMQGYTRSELRERGYSTRAVHATHRRIKQLRRLLPDDKVTLKIARAAPTASSEYNADDEDLTDVDSSRHDVSWIDRVVAGLDLPPKHGKNCPPCFRCMWFEGFMPDGKRSVRMDIEDKDVREAVKDTEARKIEIAQQVRDGLFADH